MANKRVLVVDDSCLYQQLLSDVINASDGLEVVDVAANGRTALERVAKLKPDLVTMDILMPELDGIQALIQLRKQWPALRTVMLSSVTSDGSDAALDALALGASDYALKPLAGRGVNQIRSELEEDLVPKIRALCGLDTTTPATKQTVSRCSAQVNQRTSGSESGISRIQTRTRPRIVAIGVSTGGPEALTEVLGQLPSDLDVPVVIVQHMPPVFTAKLAVRLDAACALHVREAQVGDKVRAGNVYIAPGDYHMVLDKIGSDVIINLNRHEHENSCRPAVDTLFRSLPAIYGSQVLAVIMTGMGSDGLRGCELLYEAGCSIIVQDKPTSIVWGMPGLVSSAGLAEAEFPVSELAGAITDRVRGWHSTKSGAVLIDQQAANSDSHKQQILLGRRA